jgi:ATP-dependent DNA helicase RecG
MQMTPEDKNIDYKSLRLVQKGDAGFRELAQDCVCFANAQGGQLIIGIEDRDKLPPTDQRVSVELINKTLNRLRSLCFGVAVSSEGVLLHPNGAQYFVVQVFPSLKAIATTSDGKIYLRVGDQCHAARSEDIVRLANEKDAFQWELQPRQALVADVAPEAIAAFATDIRHSPRVKNTVKAFSDLELLDHYNLTIGGQLNEQFGEITVEDIRKAVYSLVADGTLAHSPGKTHRIYWLAKKNRNEIEITKNVL